MENCGEQPLGRVRRSWEDNINVDLREINYRMERDGTGSGSCPIVSFCVRVVESSGYINRQLLRSYN
jgi:hypothetical protein